MNCTGKSGPNWLDRLRSSKGFPVSNGIDLENFLNPNSINDANLEKDDGNSNGIEEMKVVETKKSVTKDVKMKNKKRNCEKENLYDIMTSVLSELFNMGDSRNAHDFDRKRVSRKQKKPKLCVFSEVDYVKAMSPTSVGNDWREEKEIGSGFGLELEESAEDENLKDRNSGYSRADVMVIDTSAPNWKSEKLVFRKGNDWKVCERKSKCRRGFGCTKKRKSSQLSDSGSVEKRKNKKNKKMKKTILLPNEGSPQNDTTDVWRKSLHNDSQDPGKRPWFSRSPRKPAKKGSSVFNVQQIPSSRNSGDQLPN